MKGTLLKAAVRKALDSLGSPARGETLVVGLSGGADSVALLDALSELSLERGFALVAAHLDHGLREGSRDDAAFCRDLCRRLGVPLVAERADVRGRSRREKSGIEDAARAERYALLRRVKRDHGASAIAVAHTRDDQAETFLLRLMRGSGSAGLRAMRPRTTDVIRPLLAVSREAVLEHLRARSLSWREDPSNRDLAFDRNRVRLELLPYLERAFNPRIRETLARTAALLGDEADAIDALAAAALRLDARSGRSHVALADLSGLPLAARRAAVRRAIDAAGGLLGVNATHIERLVRIAASPNSSGRRLPLPGGRVAEFSFGALRIGPRRTAVAGYAFDLQVPGRVELPDGSAIVAEPTEGPAVSKSEEAVVSASGPLVVRTRRPGDRVRQRAREISLKRFLMASRVPAFDRPGLPLVATGDEVLWVPGQPSPTPAVAEQGRFVRVRFESDSRLHQERA